MCRRGGSLLLSGLGPEEHEGFVFSIFVVLPFALFVQDLLLLFFLFRRLLPLPHSHALRNNCAETDAFLMALFALVSLIVGLLFILLEFGVAKQLA